MFLLVNSVIDLFQVKYNPEVLVYEGVFQCEISRKGDTLNTEYMFEDGESFSLANLVADDIVPEGFEKKVHYRIYYEKETLNMVRVEKIE